MMSFLRGVGGGSMCSASKGNWYKDVPPERLYDWKLILEDVFFGGKSIVFHSVR